MTARRLTLLYVIIAVFVILLLAGCGGGSGNDQVIAQNGSTGETPEVVKADSSSKARNLAPQSTPSVNQSIISASNTLGVNLLGQTSGNAVVAPFAASLSLARLRAGAAGATKTGISQMMNLDASTDVDPAFNRLDLDISSRVNAATLADQSSLSSSRGWVQKRYGYLITYLDNVAENYGLQMEGADFALAQSDAWSAINGWAAQSSGGFYGSLTMGQDTRLVLGDALRLNAAWDSPFDPASTKTDWFQLLGGETVEVPFLHQQASISKASGDGFIAFELPAGGNGLRFLVILPDKDRYTEIETAFTVARLNQIVAALTPATVDLILPKFAVNGSSVELAVGNGTERDVADFSALDGTRDLYVTSRTQNAKLSITETGIQGSAVTLLALNDAHPETWTNPNSDGSGCIFYDVNVGVVPPYQIDPITPIVVGRSFFFVIRDSVTGAVLFMGRVLDPR